MSECSCQKYIPYSRPLSTPSNCKILKEKSLGWQASRFSGVGASASVRPQASKDCSVVRMRRVYLQ